MEAFDKFQFRKLDFTGLQLLVDWAKNEGWNPGINDAEIFWNTDPDGYYGYFDDDKLIAGGSLVSYNNDFGFMGFFIVKPEYRGLGIGRNLWYQRRDTLLKRLNEKAPIGMDGVVSMQPFYAKGGFEIAFRDERYEFIGSKNNYLDNIASINEKDYDDIFSYDKKCFGFRREKFMLLWLKQKHVITFKYTENNKLKGFAIIRKTVQGYKICPLFADNYLIANELFKACLNSVEGEQLYLDIPVINEDAYKLITDYKGKYIFECARMYYGNQPTLELKKIFGLTTFELG